MDNLVVIGIDCYGTYPVVDYADKVKNAGSGEKVTLDFINQASKLKDLNELRTTCQLCRFPAPKNADIAINLIGIDLNKEIIFQAESEKGKSIFESLKLENTTDNNEARQKAIKNLTEQRRKKYEAGDEIDYINIISSICIGCQNCRAVCPVCYCRECVFEGPIFQYSGAKYLSMANKKEIMKMPTGTLLFHLTRMSHVATTCVACGQCEAACPNKIPLGRLYHRFSKKVQDMLEYEAGRSLEEELPLSAYKEDELKSIEAQ
jgi:formate dehydrogenase subunit beta